MTGGSRTEGAAKRENSGMRISSRQSRRYLFYDWGKHRHGLKHCRSNLCCLLKEASWLRRVAVIQNLPLHPGHNFGVPVLGDPERYFSLPSQEPKAAGQPVRWIRFEDFEPGLKRMAPSKIRRIGQSEGYFISREDDQTYPVIVREDSGIPFRSLGKTGGAIYLLTGP